MYHRHHSWQHELYPTTTDAWPEFPDPRSPPAPPPPLLPPAAPPGPYTHHDLLAPRLALAGSLDPATGIFYRSPEHPRLRTAQACEKCRTRKAKCSGEHPTCKRCATRGLVCEYAKEGRVRGPNKPKPKTPSARAQEPPSAGGAEVLLAPSPAPLQHRRHSEGRAVRPRPSHLRLERTRPAPHASFAELYPSGGDSGRRSSCSSGGSVPSSAVSSTFDLSPAQAQAQPPQQAFEYPPGTQIHQLTHDHQQRLLADYPPYLQQQQQHYVHVPLNDYQPPCPWPPAQVHYDYHAAAYPDPQFPS